tara:strand:- start:271 stop:453 length:183 start_codon:yes stop_codon:yes gene_type:complete
MIDTDNVKGKYCSKQEMIFYLNAVEEVKRLRDLADALFNLIPSHLSTEATDVWNEHMGDD